MSSDSQQPLVNNPGGQCPKWYGSRECWTFTAGVSVISGIVIYVIGGVISAAQHCSFSPSWKGVIDGCSTPTPSPHPSASPSPPASHSPSPSPSAVASCNPPGVVNPIYIHRPEVPSTASLCGITITGNGTNYLVQPSDAQGCIFSFKHLTGTAEALTEALCGQTVNITKSPFGGFATVVQIDNPQCSTESLLISGGDSEVLAQNNPVLQLLLTEGTAIFAEAVKPGSGPYVAALAGAAITLAYDPSLSGAAMVAAQTVGPLTSKLSKQAGCTQTTSHHIAAYSAALMQAGLMYMASPDATAMAPIAAQLCKDLSASRFSTPQAERRATHLLDSGVLAVTLCATGATGAPAALLVAGCVWLVRVGREECLNTEVATDSTTAKAPPAPVRPKTPESWLEWSKRMLGCNSRGSSASPA